MKTLLIPLLLLVASCSYDKALTPDQKQQVEALDNQIIADKAQAKQMESDAALMLEKATHETDLQALAQAQAALSKMKNDYAVLTAKIDAEKLQRDQLLSSSVQQNTGGAISWALSLIPGVPQPLKENLVAALIPFIFKRPRDHAKEVLAQIGGAGKSLVKGVGLLHTEESTKKNAA